ncbi:MAG: cyclic pyranopterin monophosphate synthase MoaC [gamma proteobacterium symbiont of Ctena orbiculata]|uniref:Cyclic pyranopterin monophosphate synthase n=1 Tax=Candidatus Thiodiazotropha taylori TaxID=2792791 RepID=A0A944QTX9_9GAMM|nr:cyclic pyranopterin monophosphate synthase MoaC [Candidatus Thiodiazotropha taylori]PUB89855.1 MAG: cyclic pyranopterin monophosphate synthase MoaC [gamma proteobacterium symbiont of Ctena orbiculata]MBT2989552.1 cyclic pyranopterin monophosphate synthase MoaC [Candidatus Thiodiazotropha taylori]MBT2997132.1 cyclic pyranopterin monophosphate synthase MoaC [Candidatus Thiodiazotropha taylori]MBT3001285.1 cyclic pyranopterin monophosphate synthase MoaC [Candidatus Thiodiazotropha taylori]
MADFTHFNAAGEAHMVNVGDKPLSKRKAITEGRITMRAETLRMILDGSHKKGDVLGVARIAGIMAAKRAPELIPLCHPLSLTKVEIELLPEENENSIRCCCHLETVGQTGVEIEALCATQITLLTIYDMCKAVDRGMVIGDIRLLEKSGGKSGEWKKTD